MNLTESSGSDDHNHHVGGARTALALTARWRRAQAMLGAVVTASALAGSMVAGAATTTFGVLLDTDNNINSGCTISTADGSFAGVELVLNTTVVANSTGYRVTGITLQSCTAPACRRRLRLTVRLTRWRAVSVRTVHRQWRLISRLPTCRSQA